MMTSNKKPLPVADTMAEEENTAASQLNTLVVCVLFDLIIDKRMGEWTDADTTISSDNLTLTEVEQICAMFDLNREDVVDCIKAGIY